MTAKTKAPDQTLEEVKYLRRLVDTQAKVRIRLEGDSEVAGTIDVLPTLAYLAGADLPKKKIDGANVWPVLSGATGAVSPHEAYYYYWGRELHAVSYHPGAAQ